MERITPSLIISLAPEEVFVFGSNTVGHHAGGAALMALSWGAVLGEGAGLRGQTYAIATLDERLEQRAISDIMRDVLAFVEVAKANPELKFLVIEIGCGIAGFTPGSIAPMFRPCIELLNVHLPDRFWAVLNADFQAKVEELEDTISDKDAEIEELKSQLNDLECEHQQQQRRKY